MKEEVDFRTADRGEIVSMLLRQGSVLLRNFVDAAALDHVHDLTTRAYETVVSYHVHPNDLRALGMPMFSDILFSQRHFDLLRAVFGDRDYEISDETAARRIAQVREPPHWLPPLAPHLDAFVHAPQFTVNFWIPFRDCGIDAPALGVVQAPFGDIVSYTGYGNGAELWVDPEPLAKYTQFRREMKALHRLRDPALAAEMRERFNGKIFTPAYKRGDAMMLSNWTLHFTHATAAMTNSRESLELRFWSQASLDDILGEHGILRESAI
jgi:hypothetical protein